MLYLTVRVSHLPLQVPTYSAGKDADSGIVPAVRFFDLKIETRKIVDFAKHLGETRTVSAKRHQPIEADKSR